MFKGIIKKIFGGLKSGYDQRPSLTKRERWGRFLKEGYNPPPRGKRPKPPLPLPMTMKGGIGENISLKEVNLTIGKQGQIIITGKRPKRPKRPTGHFESEWG